MKIVAGKWRGRPLKAPAGMETRPTSGRVRETLFSMLTSRIGSFEDLSVLDLFAGSGALGLEALSRGAARCTFVEHDRSALDALRANIAKLEGANGDVRATSVMALGPVGRGCDLVFADPPYGSGAANVALDKLGRLGWIEAGAWIAVETARDEAVDAKGYDIETERNVGPARLTLLRPAAFAGSKAPQS